MSAPPDLPEIVLRSAGPEDRDPLRELFAEHLAALGYAPDAALDADMDDAPAHYQGTGNAFRVAVAPDRRLIAMGGVRQGELRRLYVRPEYRGRGVIRAVVLDLLRTPSPDLAPGWRAVVARDNLPMRQALLACGFQGTGVAPESPPAPQGEVFELPLPRDRSRPAAVVTGGSRNLGRHLVERLAARYNVVFCWRRDVEAAQATRETVRRQGGWAVGARCDVTRRGGVEFLAELTQVVAGPCQVLIHNAGHYSLAPLTAISEATWREELDSTVGAAFWAFRAFDAQLRSHPRSRMIVIGDSAAGQLRAVAHSPGYYVGKHGVLTVARSIAAHWQRTGATCNCVSPGVLPSSIDLDRPRMAVNVQFDEIGGIVDFLVSPAADAINGAHLVASRGWNV
jgi:3-oxoacyl-[acyl-carrier protein] reductase